MKIAPALLSDLIQKTTFDGRIDPVIVDFKEQGFIVSQISYDRTLVVIGHYPSSTFEGYQSYGIKTIPYSLTKILSKSFKIDEKVDLKFTDDELVLQGLEENFKQKLPDFKQTDIVSSEEVMGVDVLPKMTQKILALFEVNMKSLQPGVDMPDIMALNVNVENGNIIEEVVGDTSTYKKVIQIKPLQKDPLQKTVYLTGSDLTTLIGLCNGTVVLGITDGPMVISFKGKEERITYVVSQRTVS